MHETVSQVFTGVDSADVVAEHLECLEVGVREALTEGVQQTLQRGDFILRGSRRNEMVPTAAGSEIESVTSVQATEESTEMAKLLPLPFGRTPGTNVVTSTP